MDFPEELGFNIAVLSYFSGSFTVHNNTELLFSYSSSEYEHYTISQHRIPTTSGIWVSKTENPNLLRMVIICGCAIDAMRFLSLNYTRFKNLDEILFISIGSASSFPIELTSLIRRSKIYLLFSNDILGLVTKIKLAFFLLDKIIQINIADEIITCTCHGNIRHFKQHRLSLNVLLKSFGMRNAFKSLSIKKPT